MVVLEAMAAGVPVAASRIGGIPDLIEDGKTGFLFDPLDPGSIRQAILNWAADPQASAALAVRAKQEAMARFHPRVVAARHLEIYREVLTGSIKNQESSMIHCRSEAAMKTSETFK